VQWELLLHADSILTYGNLLDVIRSLDECYSIKKYMKPAA